MRPALALMVTVTSYRSDKMRFPLGECQGSRTACGTARYEHYPPAHFANAPSTLK